MDQIGVGYQPFDHVISRYRYLGTYLKTQVATWKITLKVTRLFPIYIGF